jgi:uncharacterized protein (TIGR02444 family)
MRHPIPPETTAGEAFWRFSLAFYAQPGAAEALIALQDRAGRDVNLMLLALWLGAARGRRLDLAKLATAEAAIGPLNAGIVHPLRHLRRELKAAADDDVQALRRRVAGLELAAERMAQYRLAAQVSGEPHAYTAADPTAAAWANLALYLGDDAASAEAATLRRAVAGLMRRV